jgi:hypothetical protein
VDFDVTDQLQKGPDMKHFFNPFIGQNDMKNKVHAVEYDIRKVQADQEGLQLNGAHQLLVSAADNLFMIHKYYEQGHRYSFSH